MSACSDVGGWAETMTCVLSGRRRERTQSSMLAMLAMHAIEAVATPLSNPNLNTLLFYTCVTPQVGNQCEEGFTLDQAGVVTGGFSSGTPLRPTPAPPDAAAGGCFPPSSDRISSRIILRCCFMIDENRSTAIADASYFASESPFVPRPRLGP